MERRGPPLCVHAPPFYSLPLLLYLEDADDARGPPPPFPTLHCLRVLHLDDSVRARREWGARRYVGDVAGGERPGGRVGAGSDGEGDGVGAGRVGGADGVAVLGRVCERERPWVRGWGGWVMGNPLFSLSLSTCLPPPADPGERPCGVGRTHNQRARFPCCYLDGGGEGRQRGGRDHVARQDPAQGGGPSGDGLGGEGRADSGQHGRRRLLYGHHLVRGGRALTLKGRRHVPSCGCARGVGRVVGAAGGAPSY